MQSVDLFKPFAAGGLQANAGSRQAGANRMQRLLISGRKIHVVEKNALF
jgi:hypothetical protein